MQSVLYLEEGIEASLLTISLFIEHYKESKWRATESSKGLDIFAAVRHRKELFHSTKLRLSSLRQRLQIVNEIVSGFLFP